MKSMLIFSFLIISLQLLTGIQGQWGYSGSNRGGISNSYNRARVLRGVYGSDGPIKSKPVSKKSRKSHVKVEAASIYPRKPTTQYFPNATIVKIGNGRRNYLDILLKCAPVITYCMITSLSPLRCILSCLLDSLESRHTVAVIPRVTTDLCYPIGSIFDRAIPTLIDEGDKIRDLPGFLKSLEIADSNHAQLSRMGAKSLAMVLIKYGKSPIHDALKPVIATLSTAINIAGNYFGGVNSQKNAVCDKVEMGDATKLMAEQFISNPFTTDVLLEGWFVLSNLGQFNRSAITPVVDGMLNFFKLMMSVQCSLIQFAETGKTSVCKDVTGYSGMAKEVKGIKHLDKTDTEPDEICGAMPDLPFADLSKIAPNVFSKDSQSFNEEDEEASASGIGFEVNLNDLDNVKEIVGEQ